jgi:hypothetical protein
MQGDISSISGKVTGWSGFKIKFRKILYLMLILLVIIMGIFIFWKYFYTYSDGYRSGVLQKFSHKGNIIKTYEGEMILRSLSDRMNVAVTPEKFNFTVTSKKMANQLDSVQGKMITVHYKQKNGTPFWRSDSKFLVDSVKLIL